MFENVEKALVGTELCQVEVNGETCMCSSRFGETVEVATGKRACIGVLPDRLPCIEVR